VVAAGIIAEDDATPEGTPPKPIAPTPQPEPDLRPLFPRLFATPSPRILPIAEQCAARGEKVPVGALAVAIRARGYVVPVDVDDMAVLEQNDNPKAGISSTGKLTGYVWRRFASGWLLWFRDHPEILREMPHESLAANYTECRKQMREEWPGPRDVSEACAITTARVMLAIYDEVSRREDALEAAATHEGQAEPTSPVAAPADPSSTP
jgi:hypothetical protein